MFTTINHANIKIQNLDLKNKDVFRDIDKMFHFPTLLNINVIVTNNLSCERISLSDTEDEKNGYIQNTHIFDTLNGFCLPPSNDDGDYNIVIHQEKYMHDGYKRTLAHELTHLIDFYYYHKIYPNFCMRSYEEIFYNLSEIHSNYIGQKYYFHDCCVTNNTYTGVCCILRESWKSFKNSLNTKDIRNVLNKYTSFIGEYIFFKTILPSEYSSIYRKCLPIDIENEIIKIIDLPDFITKTNKIQLIFQMIKDFIKTQFES